MTLTIGKKVKTKDGHIGVIKDVEITSDYYLVKFEDRTLMPNEMWYPGTWIEPFYNSDEYCPKCNNKWTVTIGITQRYYDCFKCNIKREDVMDLLLKIK